jgi:predicted RNA-binding Zn ribbon-like protein
VTVPAYPKIFRFRGNALCLDFANTMHWPRTQRIELLESFDKLLEWRGLAGLETGGSRPRTEADRVAALTDAIALRDLVQRIGFALIDGKKLSVADLKHLNARIHAAAQRREIAPAAGQLRWRDRSDAPATARILDAVTFSLVDLLTTGDLTRLKSCDRCDWLFLDTTKNNTRRWCSMKSCGAHVKAQAYYQRKTARDNASKVAI